jgi:PAS domain-containing protein
MNTVKFLNTALLLPADAENASFTPGNYTVIIFLFLFIAALIALSLWLFSKNKELNLALKEKEFEIKTLERNHIDLYDNSPFVSFTLNPRGQIIDCNAKAYQLLNLKRIDLWGKPLRNFFDSVPPGMFENYLKNSFDRKYGAFKIEFRDYTGEIVQGTAFCASTFNFSGELISIRMTLMVADIESFTEKLNDMNINT